MTVYIDMDGVVADFASWMKTFIPNIEENIGETKSIEVQRMIRGQSWMIM